MTPTEITAHAIELGITPEKFPEFFVHDKTSVWTPGPTRTIHYQYRCTLPDPDSDDPRCPLWDGFYMRALGWPLVYLANDKRWRVANEIKSLTRMTILGGGPTPTAALRAAWLAKEATARRAAQRIGGDHG